jgi:hypothetical protein
VARLRSNERILSSDHRVSHNCANAWSDDLTLKVMLYFLKTGTPLSPLPTVPHLQISEADDPLLMSIMGKVGREEAARRLANDNKAYVAFYRNTPAAFGWMAMGKAKIGELGHEFILPMGHRYLWNFRTFEEFRGLGIYPRMLQFIIDSEFHNADCFWILHAPENTSSEKGIVKAGFRFAGSVSVREASQLIAGADDLGQENAKFISELGFQQSHDEPATCWHCTSPYLAHKKTECCCQPKGKECNEALFATTPG